MSKKTNEKRLNFTTDKIIYYTKLILIILSLLTAVPFINSTFRDLYKVLSVWSVGVIIYLFIKKKAFRLKEYILLVLFCVSYVITIFINREVHFINEVAILVQSIMMFFLMTYIDGKKSEEKLKKELIVYGWAIVIVSFIFAIVNSIELWLEIAGVINIKKQSFFTGIIDNRMGGLYNPNSGSTISLIAFVISILLWRAYKSKVKRIILGISIVVEFISFSACQSRGSSICLLVFIILNFVFIRKEEKYKGIKKYATRLMAAFLVCLLVGGLGQISNSVMWNIPKVTNGDLFEKDIEDAKRKKVDESSINGVSAGRTKLWETAINAYKEGNKAFGMGFRSIDDAYARKLSWKSYKNSAAGGTHNVYITVLVSAGYVGMTLFVLFMLLILKRILSLLISAHVPDYVKNISALLCACFVADLFESRFVFGMNHFAVFCWISIGIVMYYSEEYKIGKHNNSSI